MGWDAVALIFFCSVPWIVWVLIYYLREMKRTSPVRSAGEQHAIDRDRHTRSGRWEDRR